MSSPKPPLLKMMEKPKRPLSSFNLFYRYKRALVLENVGDTKEDVHKILWATAGLEEVTITHQQQQQPPLSNEINMLRRTKIREALKDKILPTNNGRRRHRKSANSCGISFSEMGKLMTTCWKRVDSFAKAVFEELSEEGRQIYRIQMKEYNKLHPQEPKSAPAYPKPKNNGAKKQSESMAAHLTTMNAAAAAALPAAAFPAAGLPHGLSIPMHTMAYNWKDAAQIAAFQRIPMVVPTNSSYIPPAAAAAAAQYIAALMKSPPIRRTNNEKKKEAKPSRREGVNMDILAAAAAAVELQPKRNLPIEEPKRSLPLKKRFKRP